MMADETAPRIARIDNVSPADTCAVECDNNNQCLAWVWWDSVSGKSSIPKTFYHPEIPSFHDFPGYRDLQTAASIYEIETH